MAQEQDYLAKKDYVDENYQPRLVAGTGISINPITNEITSSGGGSLVTYAGNPNISQGDSLGVLTINGTSNTIMSPGLIPGTNVTITTDITTGAKTIAATGGTTVTPNPQGTPSGVLTSIGIGNTIYSLQGGAYYGTTDPDSSLGIDGDIYIKYTSGTPDTIDAMFVKINDEWIEAELGGGGSDVEITPSYQSGTKIADYEINEVPGALYIPEEHVTLTQAQYNALTPAEKNNGKIYFISDVAPTPPEEYIAAGTNITFDTTTTPGTTIINADGGASAVEVLQLTASSYIGYDITVTHEDNITTFTETVPASGIVFFNITKPGTWTITNSKDSKTKTHVCNLITMNFGGISSSFTLDVASSNISQSFNCSEGYYIVLCGTTGSGSESSYRPVTISVNSGGIIYQERVFDPPGGSGYCSDMRVVLIEATNSSVITATPGSYDQGRIMILHTSEPLSEENVKLLGTKKDNTYTGSFNLESGDKACVFCLGTQGNSKTISATNVNNVEEYNTNNMNYNYLTASADTTVSISFWGGSSYGSSGVCAIG